MTRKEAIKWLNKLYARADITDEYGDIEDMQPYEEAIDMAINSLEIDERYELEYEQTVICPSYGIDCKDCPAYDQKESEDKE